MTRLTQRIASNIRARREDAGLSQEALAREARVATRTVSRLENGETENPRRPELHRIAQALGTTIDGLMGIDDEPESSVVDGEPTDEELDAELERRTSDPDLLLAFMARVRDPKRMSRQAKLVILEDLRKVDAQRRRQG